MKTCNWCKECKELNQDGFCSNECFEHYETAEPSEDCKLEGAK